MYSVQNCCSALIHLLIALLLTIWSCVLFTRFSKNAVVLNVIMSFHSYKSRANLLRKIIGLHYLFRIFV